MPYPRVLLFLFPNLLALASAGTNIPLLSFILYSDATKCSAANKRKEEALGEAVALVLLMKI